MDGGAPHTRGVDQDDPRNRRENPKASNGKGYKVELEEVDHANELRIQIAPSDEPPSDDYQFCPMTFPLVSRRAKELCRERHETVYIVYSDDKEERRRQGLVHKHIGIVGYHFPHKTLKEALQEHSLYLPRGSKRFKKYEGGRWRAIGDHYNSIRPTPQNDQRAKGLLEKNGLGHIPNPMESREVVLQVMKEIFPKIPLDVAGKIVDHAWKESSKGKERVGTSPNKKLSLRVELAVTAYIRHNCTMYDDVIGPNDKSGARRMIQTQCLRKMLQWKDEPETPQTRHDFDELFREVIVIEDSSDESDRYDEDDEDSDDSDDSDDLDDSDDSSDSDDSEASVVILSSRPVPPRHVLQDYRSARNEQHVHNPIVYVQDRYQRNADAIRVRPRYVDPRQKPSGTQDTAVHNPLLDRPLRDSNEQMVYSGTLGERGFSVHNHGYGQPAQSSRVSYERVPPPAAYSRKYIPVDHGLIPPLLPPPPPPNYALPPPPPPPDHPPLLDYDPPPPPKYSPPPPPLPVSASGTTGSQPIENEYAQRSSQYQGLDDMEPVSHTIRKAPQVDFNPLKDSEIEIWCKFRESGIKRELLRKLGFMKKSARKRRQWRETGESTRTDSLLGATA
ncbi:hypothetical protein K490DRAFT_60453 [Saccharata proteae CBS 121410]|uniref:DUF2293 domain-containing protein n=1 Tax=Saccharata proteae CBS 121410 TaxID=1314787 RepID=A0A9P4HMV9_9PEZI|nr:hypothetical protein K490DRAFT_60453 [Saccharata proteae CBS 121410]